MSRRLGERLPPEVLSGLDVPAGPQGQVTLVVTTDADGHPHLTQLSNAQIAVLEPRALRVAMWMRSGATANARRTGGLVLFRVDESRAYTIRLRCGEPVTMRLDAGPVLAVFTATVVEVVEDSVPYAELASPLSYRLDEPDQVLPLWQEMRRRLQSGRTG